MIITDQLARMDALVAPWLPGSRGEGVADVLFGRRPFTGRLSMTWPRILEQEPINIGDRNYHPCSPTAWGCGPGAADAGRRRRLRRGGERPEVVGDAGLVGARDRHLPPHLATPALQARRAAKNLRWERAIAARLRQRGVSEQAALLVSKVALACFQTAYERWVRRPGQDLPELVDESFAVLAGLAG
jgi:hypothetical protein